MKNRFLKVVTALCVLFLIIGGILYIFRQHKHKQVKARYDTYMAQLDDLSVGENGLLKPLTDEGNDPEYDAIYEKADKARNYLMKHAPHLLPKKDSSEDSDESYKAFLSYLQKNKPDAAAKLEAELAQNNREYEAKIAANEAQLAAWEQEARDLDVQIEADKKRREADRVRYEQSRLEYERMKAKIDTLIEKMRAELVFDDAGNPIGFKNLPSAIEETLSSGVDDTPDTQTPSGPAVPLDVPSDPEREPNAPNMPSDPRLWQETLKGEMARFDVGFYEKYPDVAIRSQLSEAEYQVFFPTAEAKRALQRRTEAVQRAYAKQLDSVLRRLPRQSRQQMLQGVRDDLTQNWDADFADAVIEQLQLDQK
ncbi:MAG: hypothetical protein OXI67_20710 [Candidatus Poribacteria bacterium]|nr:hypothetical protein [Candidatus Poribacteria bacterium]